MSALKGIRVGDGKFWRGGEGRCSSRIEEDVLQERNEGGEAEGSVIITRKALHQAEAKGTPAKTRPSDMRTGHSINRPGQFGREHERK